MLEIKDLSFSFVNHVIYKHLNMDFQPGKITGIVGANGVGKTTLFRIIAGMYPLQSGSVLLQNKKLKSREVSFLMTDPFFYPYMKGQEYIDIVVSTTGEKIISEKYAAIFQLPLNELVDNYSTGMKKKLSFATLFASEKSVIILDEPYNGVDLAGNEIIKHLIKSESGSRVVVLSSHILSTLTDVCDGIYHIKGHSEVNYYEKSNFTSLENQIKKEILME